MDYEGSEITDFGRVVSCAEDQLGRTVVTGANVGNIGLILHEDLSRPKVAKFQDAAVRVKKKILRFDVTVTNALRVNVCQGAEELVDV